MRLTERYFTQPSGKHCRRQGLQVAGHTTDVLKYHLLREYTAEQMPSKKPNVRFAPMCQTLCSNILSYSLYSSSTGRVVSLNNVSFFVSKGEVVSVVGLSGIGKSTLLNMLEALDRPTSGKVFLDGIDIFSLNDFFISQLATVRNNKLGFIF